MKKKIILVSLLTILLSNFVIMIGGYFAIDNIHNKNSTYSTRALNELIVSSSKLFKERELNSVEDLKKDLLQKLEYELKKDALLLKPLIEEHSFLNVASFLKSVYEFDPVVIKTSFVGFENNQLLLWQWVDDKYSNGTEIMTKYNSKTNEWSTNYNDKAQKLLDPILGIAKNSKKLKMFLKTNTNISEFIKESKLSSDAISIEGFYPIFSNAELLGYLRYEYSLKELFAKTQKEAMFFYDTIDKVKQTSANVTKETKEITVALLRKTLISSISFVFIVIIFAIFLLSFLGTRILRPLTGFIETIKTVAKGEYVLHTVIKSKDEVEILGNHFNQMVVAIKKRDSELLEYQNNLENILEKRTLELEEERSKNIQDSKLASLGEMAAGIAHEINNPLAIIQMSVKVGLRLMQKLNDIDPRFEKVFKDIDGMVIRASKIIEGLKTISRDSSGDKEQLVTTTNIINETLLLCSERFKSNNIEIQKDFEESSYQICCNYVQISQVILNIINNAFDVVAKEKGKQWIKISTDKEDKNIKIIISNSGIKMSSAIKDKVLQPFFTTKPLGEGTGLGLSIARGIVKNHNGDIDVDLSGEFTCFVIVLPEAELITQNAD